ncbi:MAG: LapA family protein [Sphingomonas sp.]|uniref:LapA family protein n=1 Tax=Sphingomonas sp. TaxID=28214 RepID=UPI001B0DA9E2|nr:LapA family protein [Sphingomonas sp.]MBO9623205.1 LapA family protein [Sphingomonas sp.]
MRFLKVLIWLLLGGLVAGFVIYNGDERVSIHLWGGLIADFSLPLLLILVFLAGLLPPVIAYQTLRWRMRQRFASLERALADLRAVNQPPAEPAVLSPEPSLTAEPQQ